MCVFGPKSGGIWHTYRGGCVFGGNMRKYQKPIRSVYDELFDVELSYEKRERLEEAYESFWATLDEDIALELDLLLL
jgi:hypothetical protein